MNFLGETMFLGPEGPVLVEMKTEESIGSSRFEVFASLYSTVERYYGDLTLDVLKNWQAPDERKKGVELHYMISRRENRLSDEE